MEQNGAEKKNIAVTKPDMSLLSTSQLPMSSFGMLSMSFAQDIIDRDTVETNPVPMFSLDYLEEENSDRAQEVVVSPVLNLDFRFLMQQMERLEGIKKDIHEEVKFIREGDVYRLSPVSQEKRTQLHIKNITQRCAELQEKRHLRSPELPGIKMISSVPEEHGNNQGQQVLSKQQNPFIQEAVSLEDLYGQERTDGGERSVDPQLILNRINELALKQKEQMDSFREKLDNPDYQEKAPGRNNGRKKRPQRTQAGQEISGSIDAAASLLPEKAEEVKVTNQTVNKSVVTDHTVKESVERSIRETIEKQDRNSVSELTRETEIRSLTEKIEKKYIETAATAGGPELDEFVQKELEAQKVLNMDRIREKQELRRVYLPGKKDTVSRRPLGAWKPAGAKYKDGITTAQAEMLFSNVIQAEQQLGLTYGMQDGAELGSPMDRIAYLKETTKQIRRKEQLAEDLMSVPAGILPEEELYFLEELTQQTGVSDHLLSVAEAEIRRALEAKSAQERKGSAAAENVPKTTGIAAGTTGIEIRTEAAEKSSKSEERTEKDRIIRKTVLLNRIRMSLLSGESEDAKRLLEQFGREAAIQEQQELNYLPLPEEQKTMKPAENKEAPNKIITDKTVSDKEFSDKKPSERGSSGTGSASTRTGNAEAVNSETINTETINTETINTETINTETINTETINTETINTETKTEPLNAGARNITVSRKDTVSYLRESELVESVRFLLQEGKEQEAERLIFQYEKKTGIDTEKLDHRTEREFSETISGSPVITAYLRDPGSGFRQAAAMDQGAESVYPEMEEFSYLEENADQELFSRLEREIDAGKSSKALEIISEYIRGREQSAEVSSEEKEERRAAQPLRLQEQKEQQHIPEAQELLSRRYPEKQTIQLLLENLKTSLDEGDFQKAGTLLLDYEKQSTASVLSDKQAVKPTVKKNKKSAGTGETKNVNLPERVDELEYLKDRQEGPEAGRAGKTVQQSTEAGMQPAESRVQQAKDQIQQAEGRMSFRKEILERISVLVREKNADEARKLVAGLESELKAFYSAEAVQKTQGSAEEETAIPTAQGSTEGRAAIRRTDAEKDGNPTVFPEYYRETDLEYLEEAKAEEAVSPGDSEKKAQDPKLQQSSDERVVIRRTDSKKDGTPAIFPEYYRETDLEYLEEEKADGATKAGEAVQKLQFRPESRSPESRSPESRSPESRGPEENTDTVSARIELVRQLQTYLRNGQVAKAQKLITRYRDIIGRQEFGTPEAVPEKGMLENVDLGYLETAEKAADGQLMPGIKSGKSAAQTSAPKEGRTGRPVIRREAGQPWQVPGYQEIENAPTHETGRFDEHPLDISYVTVPSENAGPQSAGSREPGKPAEKTSVPNGQTQSEYYKSLPEWTRKFFETGYQENGGTASQDNETSGGAAGSGPIPAGRNITWSNPSYPNAVSSAAPMQEIVLKKNEENQPSQVHISEREIRRTAEKVYKILEERLRNERRRHGF